MPLLVVALVLPALAQENRPEQGLFRKMEQQLAAAKTLRFTFTLRLEGNPEQGTFEGTVTLAEGNKMRLDITGRIRDEAVKAQLVADGTRLKMTRVGGPPEERVLPPNLNEAFKAAVARAGLYSGVEFLEKRRFFDEKGKDLDVAALLTVDEFKLGPREKLGGREAQAVSYQVRLEDKGVITTTVWIDVKTALPLKRVVHVEGRRVTAVETYIDLTPDVKPDPKLFDLPTAGFLSSEGFSRVKEISEKGLPQISKFTLGKKEKVGERELQRLEAKVATDMRKQKITGTVTLWLDAKTSLPFKHVVTSEGESRTVTITQTYPQLRIDEKIDPKLFELPK